MRRKIKYAILLVILFLLPACVIATKYSVVQKQDDVKISVPPEGLKIGEVLTYKAEWLGMDVGTASLSVKGITERNGRKVYHIIALAQTSPLISKVYKVEDEVSSYLDVEELYPVRFEKKQREGGYRSDEYIDFDQKKGKAFYFSRLNHDKKEYYIPEKAQDPLSCLYFFRLQDLGEGKTIFADVIADEKNYLLEAKIEKKGIIKIEGVGEWEAFMVEPLPWFQGKIKRRAKASIWFSADKKRIPLLVTTSGIPFVGSITITLQKVEYNDESGQ